MNQAPKDPVTTLRQKLLVAIDDLQKAGHKDMDAMWFTGKFGAELAEKLGAETWSATRRPTSRTDFEAMLRAFDQAGVEHARAGRDKHAYAVQTLALGWVSRAYSEPDITGAGQLLDEIIDHAIAFYRATPMPAAG